MMKRIVTKKRLMRKKAKMERRLVVMKQNRRKRSFNKTPERGGRGRGRGNEMEKVD